MIEWQYYPAYDRPNHILESVIRIFESNFDSIRSDRHTLNSNEVLKKLRASLSEQEFRVEAGKSRSQRVEVPVLFGRNGKIAKYFDADAYNEKEKVVFAS